MISFRVDGIPVPQGSMKVFNGHVVHNKGAELAVWRSAGIIRERIVCDKCGTEADPGNYKRFHGINCIGIRGVLDHPGKGNSPVRECPYCKIQCKPGNYKKYHGDMCWNNPTSERYRQVPRSVKRKYRTNRYQTQTIVY